MNNIKIILAFFIFNSFISISYAQEFAYTSLSDCKTVKSDPAPESLGYVLRKCSGPDGYTIWLQSADSRSWLIFEKGNIKLDLQKDFLESPFQFADIAGDKLEWRYKNNSSKRNYYAAIFRVAGSDAENPDKIIQSLFVIRLSDSKPGCLLGRVKTNEEARLLADSQAQCK